MGFRTSNRSSQPVDKALPRIKTSLKKCNASNGTDKNLLFLPRRKTSAAYCESEIEDIDIDMQLKRAEGMYDESNYMWLSLDCDSLPRTKTSAAFCEPGTEVDIDMQLKLTEGMSDESNCMWLSSDCDSLLSSDLSGDIYQLNSWNHSFIDGLPLMKSENRDSTVHDLQIDLSGELLKEKGVLSDQSISCHGSRGFSYDRFQMGSSIYESSSTSLSTIDDFDRNGSWITPFDLNLESSELIQLKDDGVNSICSDFSSPTYSYRRNPRSESSFSSPSSVTTIHMTEAFSSLSSEYEQDEPLFWPYNQKLYESSELGKSFFCVSPRKDKNMARNKVVNELKSVEVKLKKTNSLSANKKSTQLQCGRKPELSQKATKSATGWKSIAPKCNIYNNSQRPPLHSSTYLAQASAKSLPCNTLTKKRIKTNMKETTQLKSKNQRSKVEELPAKSLLEFEASFFYEVFMEDATIEKLVGLNEFDSHEWLNFKLREDCFIECMKKEKSSQLGRETFFLQLFGKTL